MKYSGGLYSIVHVGPKTSRTIHISQQGYYYTKTKAEKALCETIYSKDDAFFCAKQLTRIFGIRDNLLDTRKQISAIIRNAYFKIRI